MPIRNCPFPPFPDNHLCLRLPITIINPKTNQKLKTFGIIDTGASECAIPARIAMMLGHNLIKGKKKNVSTGNGLTNAFRHTTTLLIHHPTTPNIDIFTIDNVLIDCLPNLNMVLLGVNGFLSNFVLNIDYPNKTFSLTKT